MQPQTKKKVARADRIEGSIVLYRSAARSQFKAQRPLSRGEPWWNMVFGVPLFLRTLLRLVFVCPHRHKGPPVTLRESIPSNLSGCRPVCGRGSYITCLDCGQKFAYNHRTGHLVDFWGVHDAEALAGVRRRLEGWALRGLAARGEGVPRLIVEEAASELGRNEAYVAQRQAADSAKAEPVFAPDTADSMRSIIVNGSARPFAAEGVLLSISLAKWRRGAFAVLRKIGQSAFPTRLLLRRCWFDFKRDWSAMIDAMALPKMKSSFLRWLHQPIRPLESRRDLHQ
jgi:hypothetical protein